MKSYKLEKSGNLLILRAFIEGQKGRAYLKLLLDTGSAYTIIAQEILENIGCGPTTAKKKRRIITGSGYEIVPVVSVQKFHCLGKVVRNFEILAHTLPSGTYVDGLLGMDFLSRFNVQIKVYSGEVFIT